MEPADGAPAEVTVDHSVMGPPASPLAVVRLRQLAVCLLLTAAVFSQSPGRIANDTKLDLTSDPWHFLHRALHMWSPDIGFGEISNQGYGYLFPMGPFHALGVSAGLPEWVVQRAWMSLLLVVAFLGCVRLAARLGVGTPTTRLLAGIAYALSPRVLTELGGISSELLPLALLPWTLVPLVGPLARAQPRRSAARSGAAVLLMGAVNATATLAVLPAAGVFVLAGVRSPAGRRLAAWEAVSVALACAWWMGPLLLQGAYAVPFLDWIETAAVTTRPTSLLSTLRGTSHWLAYLAPGGSPWWRSGWTLVTSPIVIVDTTVVAALGIAGIARRDLPARRRLAVVAALGLLGVTAGHVGPFAPFEAAHVRALLDGPLAPFRNVHKFDPLLRLPLALGLAHVVGRLWPARRSAGIVLVAVALVGAATPVLAGELIPSGGYDRLPFYWQQSASWLDQRSDQGHALLVPGGSMGEYVWGRPLDEPLQSLTRRTTWAVRDAVPLGSAGLTRLLDAVETRLDSGTGSAGLAPVLQRMGVRFLVVRNDLDRRRTGAPLPVLVHAALAASPGISRAASFGPTLGSGRGTSRFVGDRGLDVRYPAVEVFTVGAAVPQVQSLPRVGTDVLSGGPESLFALADRGLLGPATVLAGDGDPGPAARSVVTDGLRKRRIAFGQGRDNGTETLTREQPADVGQPAADFLVVPGEQHMTVAQLIGARRVIASSSASDPLSARHRPDRQPWSAVDGSGETAWVSGSARGAIGQWLEVQLDAPREMAGARLAVVDDPDLLGPPVAEVEVRTDAGTAKTRLTRTKALQPLRVPAGRTRTVRVTVTALKGTDASGVLAGFAELSLPGVSIARTLVLPDDAPRTRAEPLVLVDRAPGARAGCVALATAMRCSPELGRPGEERVQLDRTFVLRAGARLDMSGTAEPVPGRALDALLDRGAAVRVTASSRATPDAADRPGVVVDGNVGTSWVAADNDKAPALSLHWDRPVAVDRLRLRVDRDLAASRAEVVEVDGGGRRQRVTVDPDGTLRFGAVRTDHLTLRFRKDSGQVSGDAVTGRLVRLGVGVSEVQIPGVTGRATPDGPLRLACGQGPPVALDGQLYPTALLTTRGELLRQRPALLSVCAPGPTVALSAGRHRLVGSPAPAFAVAGMTVGSQLPSRLPQVRSTSIRRWAPTSRQIQVGPGKESWLVVHENANSGWTASLAGKPLAVARIDGWQQAWVVPAGAGGRVALTYRPDAHYRQLLLLGLLAALLLLVLALRRGQVLAADSSRAPVRFAAPAAAVLFALAIAGPAGLLSLLLGLVVQRITRAAAYLAGGALLAAGLLEALRPWAAGVSPASTGRTTQVLCLVAIGITAASLSRPAFAVAPAAPPGGSSPPPGPG